VPRRLKIAGAIVPLLLCFLFWAPSARGAAEGDGILGFWLTQDRDAIFEIYKCGTEYCGKIAALEEPEYPLTAKSGLAGRPRMDRKNPEPALRSRPLLGLPIISVHYKGDNSWWGTVYNPDDGKTYKCKLSVAANGDQLKVRGYLGVVLFGQTQTWTRRAGNTNIGGTKAASPAQPSS